MPSAERQDFAAFPGAYDARMRPVVEVGVWGSVGFLLVAPFGGAGPSDKSPDNLVVITGDIHLAGVGQLTTTADRTIPRGVEFVTTSISSSGNVDASTEALFVALPNIIDAEVAHRRSTMHSITADSWTADYRIVDNALIEGSAVTTGKTFTVQAGVASLTEI